MLESKERAENPNEAADRVGGLLAPKGARSLREGSPSGDGRGLRPRGYAMEAALLVELGRFEIHDLNRLQPGRGELLVRVEACGVCGSDVRIFRHGHPRIPLPQVLGHEIVGTVVETGG